MKIKKMTALFLTAAMTASLRAPEVRRKAHRPMQAKMWS